MWRQMAQAYSLCLLIMFIIPIYLFSEIFTVWAGVHLFFLHQGPFTSLAATEMLGLYTFSLKSEIVNPVKT